MPGNRTLSRHLLRICVVAVLGVGCHRLRQTLANARGSLRAVAECPRLLKGYGDTHARGSEFHGGDRYWERSAFTGSMRAAFRAGTIQAMTDTTAVSAGTARNVTGSAAETP